ncbi:MAG: MMPL family transporter [Abyssibacter sp.]|uniref:efflux RND transporter permease subunit n=1 Tax=Abyssibacter sp. TaxID=2320200 RepID=UPI00321B2E96
MATTSASNSGWTDRILRVVEPLVYGKRWVGITWLTILTVLLSYQALQLEPDAGFEKSIPLEHPYMNVFKQYQSDFGGANTVLVALLQKDGSDIYNGEFLEKLKFVTDEVFYVPGNDRRRVTSLFTRNVRYIEVVEGGLSGANVVPADYQPTQANFDLIRTNVGKADIIGRLVTEDESGALVQTELLEFDPQTGEKLDYRAVAAELERIRGSINSPRKWEYRLKQPVAQEAAGTVVATKFSEPGKMDRWFGKTTVVSANEDGVPITVEVNNRDLDIVEMENENYSETVSVHIIGFAKIIGDVTDATLEVVGFFLLTLLMTFVLLWGYTSSLKLAFLPLACSIVAVIWEFGLLTTAGYGLDPFAILVPFLVLSVSVSHGVQYVNAWVDEIAAGKTSYDASLETFRRLAIPGTTALITDVAGFATIYLIPIDIIREMSLNAAFGVASIIITNKVMMPIWLTYVSIGDVDKFQAKQAKKEALLAGLFRFLAKITRRGPAIATLLVCAVLLAISLYKYPDLQVGDAQKGVPELRPDSRYNQDSAAIVENFDLGVDILKVVAETDPEACRFYHTMEQVDRFLWTMQNTGGVQTALGLPTYMKLVYSGFNEGHINARILPRNPNAMALLLSQFPSSTGLLNSDCSAMAMFVFTEDHKAGTIKHIVNAVEAFNAQNAERFANDHPGTDLAVCEEKTQLIRQAGQTALDLKLRNDRLVALDANSEEAKRLKSEAESLQTKLGEQREQISAIDSPCPVNFALATGNVGVMAATNEVVEEQELQVVFWVYVVVILFLWLSFRTLAGVICVVAPLSLVSIMAYAVMAMTDIGLKVATLPVVALAVGIGVDYGIYVYATLVDGIERGLSLEEAMFETLNKTGKAVLFTGVALGVGVGTWLFSALQFQADMGLLLVFMFTANMFGAILVLPALARFLTKRSDGSKPA